MKQHRGVLERVAQAADLPLEPLPRIPLVELAGTGRVLIENHMGVTQYGSQQIQVQVSYGHILICGSGLELARMTHEQLVITGCVRSVSLHRGER